MHARVGLYHFKPDQLDQALSIIRDSVVPTMKRQAGFKRVWLMTDPRTSRALSISLWESEDAMHVSEGSGGYFQDALIKLAPLFIGSPVVEHYDVSVQA